MPGLLPRPATQAMIYVDHLIPWPGPPAAGAEKHFGNGKPGCHLWCDQGNEEDLHRLAARIGLRREWFQIGRLPWLDHYDLTPAKRRLALQHGARETSYRAWINAHTIHTTLTPNSSLLTPSDP